MQLPRNSILIIAAVFCFGGCVGTRQAQSNSAQAVAASHETTIRQALTHAPSPALPTSRNVTVTGSSNVVTVVESLHEPSRLHANTEPEWRDSAVQGIVTEIHDGENLSGTASQAESSKWKFGLSAPVVAFIGACALVIGFLGIKLWKTTAAGQAMTAGFSTVETVLRNALAHAKDDAHIASLSTVQAAVSAAKPK